MAIGNPEDEHDGLSETDDLEELYSGDYLRDCADGEARAERLAELRRRIEQRAYTIDANRIALVLLESGLKS
jgi:anti-sigma28 factor (negative regulator of flagellin synthesis)